MLLIGSLAARHHFPDFRRARGDADLIATRREADRLTDSFPVLKRSPEKVVLDAGRLRLEVEVAERGSSSFELIPHSDGEADVEGVGRVPVASPAVLMLLKASHVCFPLRWEKSFRDYKFLQNKVRFVPVLLAPVLEQRIGETKERLRFKDRDFGVANEEFFEKSSHAVHRFIPHDDLHQIVSGVRTPAYKLMKDDQSKAAVSTELFRSIPFPERIRAMREEVMVLALERHILPACSRKEPFSERLACEKIMKGLCHNFLPFGLRMFAIDHFYAVLRSIPDGFSAPIASRVLSSIC